MQYTKKRCTYCGKIFRQLLRDDTPLKEQCYYCYFWLKKVNLAQHHLARRVIVKGGHYMIGENHPEPFKGFGGRDFSIKFYDGRRIETSNLWHQGEIPERFKKFLPDNAVFVQVIEKQAPSDDNSGIYFNEGGDENVGMV